MIIKGYVQGVGYRAYVCATARWMNIKGTIKNIKDGLVEIYCECKDEKHFQQFKNEIDLKGTDRYSAHVDTIEIESINGRKLEYFDIDYGDTVNNKEIVTKIDIGSNIMRSMNTNMTTRFDNMEQKYDTIGKTLIKLEKQFSKLVEEFIGKKKKKP